MFRCGACTVLKKRGMGWSHQPGVSWNWWGFTGILVGSLSTWFTCSLGPIPRWNTNTCCSCTPWKLSGSDAARPAVSHQNFCGVSYILPETSPFGANQTTFIQFPENMFGVHHPDWECWWSMSFPLVLISSMLLWTWTCLAIENPPCQQWFPEIGLPLFIINGIFHCKPSFLG